MNAKTRRSNTPVIPGKQGDNKNNENYNYSSIISHSDIKNTKFKCLNINIAT